MRILTTSGRSQWRSGAKYVPVRKPLLETGMVMVPFGGALGSYFTGAGDLTLVAELVC